MTSPPSVTLSTEILTISKSQDVEGTSLMDKYSDSSTNLIKEDISTQTTSVQNVIHSTENLTISKSHDVEDTSLMDKYSDSSTNLINENTSTQTTSVQNVIHSTEILTISVSEDALTNDISCEKSDDLTEMEIEGTAEKNITQNTYTCQYNWSFNLNDICQVAKASECFQSSHNFTKGCKWSPDGQCLLSNSDDNLLRLFNLPQINNNPENEMSPVFAVKEGGLIYDFCWYPLMNSSDALSCGFLSTSRGSPIHLLDAYTGHLRASYRGYNKVDEVESALSIAFSPDGQKIYSGYRDHVKVFYTARPGRDYSEFQFKNSTAKYVFQQGLASCLATNPVLENVYAVGDYSSTIGIYSDFGNLVCLLSGHREGLTQLSFTSDGRYLWAGARHCSELLCWDMRSTRKPVFSLDRKLSTAQRIYFDLTTNNKFLATGNEDGYINIWDLTKTINESLDGPTIDPLVRFKAHSDCVNGISFNPLYPILASSSGQRHNYTLESSDSESEIESEIENQEESMKIIKKRRCGEAMIKLWWCSPLDN